MGHQLIKRILMVFVSSLFLTACDEQPKTPDIFDGTDNVPVKHEHTYSDVWQSDSQFHWHQATCEHTTEIKDNAPHQFDLVENIAPTYSSEGHKKYVCLVCQYVNEVILDKVAHTYSDQWTTNSQGHWHACLDEGFESSKADYSVHTFTTKVVEPTFESKGSITYTCSVCGFVAVEDIPMVEHEYDLEVWSNDETGHWHACKDEGYEGTEKKDFQPHSFNVTVKEPTFEEVGVTTYRCVECNYTYYVETSIKEHTYSNSYSFDKSGHWHQCVDAGYSNLKKDSEIHDFVGEIIDPTFETPGYIRKTCKVCGYVDTEVTSDPLEHNFDTNWVNNSYYHWHYCIDEGYETLKSNQEAHNYIYDETEPGPYTQGKRVATCKDCGYTYTTMTPSLFEECDGKWNFEYYSYGSYYIFTGFTENVTVGFIPETYNDKPVRRIKEYSLTNSNLEKVYIGNNVSNVDYYAFGNYSYSTLQYLKYISIGNSISSFNVCTNTLSKVTKIRCGTSISDVSFTSSYPSLETIIVDEDNPNFSSAYGLALNKAGTKVVQCPRGKTDTVIIPDGVTTIGSYSFSWCEKFDSIYFENPSLITIIEQYAFQGASKLKCLKHNLINLQSIGNFAFNGTRLESIYLPLTLNFLGSYCLYIYYEKGIDVIYEGTEEQFNSIEKEIDVFYPTYKIEYLGEV